VAVRSLYAWQGAVLSLKSGIDGEGQLSAFSAPLFLTVWVSSVFSDGSALITSANGFFRQGAAVAGALVDGETEFDAEADPEPDFVAVPLGVVDADVLGAVSSRCDSPAPLLLADPDAAGDGDVDGELLPEAVGLPLGLVALRQVTAWAGAITPRKLRIAAWPSLLTSAPVPLGISITSWSPPWTTTVAPVTP
jgi:hypothetical protein